MAIEVIDLPMKNCGFHQSFLYVYQRVYPQITDLILPKTKKKNTTTHQVSQAQEVLTLLDHFFAGLLPW